MCIELVTESNLQNVTKPVVDSELGTYTQYHRIVLCRAQGEQHAHEVSIFQAELAEAHSQLQILRKQLDEEISKRPLTNQEVSILVVVPFV